MVKQVILLVFQKQVDNSMKMNTIRKFFISFNQNLLKKKSMFIVNGNVELERILYLLYRDSLILSYSKENILNNNFRNKEKYIYKVYLATDAVGLSTIKKIIILKNNEYINIRLNNLKILESKIGYKWVLIHTTKGLFTLFDCIKFKLGGQLLVYLK